MSYALGYSASFKDIDTLKLHIKAISQMRKLQKVLGFVKMISVQ